jgi:CRP/FNR family cyclic AMP-dependent transcriptional regulator
MLTAHQELKRRIDALGRVPLFSGCTRRELARVDRLGTRIDVSAGRVLAQEGEDGRECFVVLEGTASVRRGIAEVGVIGPDSIAGEMALLYDAPRTATVIACTRMRLLVLHADEFDALLNVAPCIKRDVDRIAGERSLRDGYATGMRVRADRRRPAVTAEKVAAIAAGT